MGIDTNTPFLTDEERAEFGDGLKKDDETEALERVAAGATDDDADAQAAAAAAAATGSEGKGAETPPAAEGAAAPASGAASGEGEAATPATAASGPSAIDVSHLTETHADTTITPPVDNLPQKLAELQAQLLEVRKKHASGDEATTDEVLAQEEIRITAEASRLASQQAQHDASVQRAQKATEQAWERDFGVFAATVKTLGGPDYSDPKVFPDFVDAIDMVAKRAARAGETLTRPQLMARAHEALAKITGAAPIAAAGAGGTAAATGRPAAGAAPAAARENKRGPQTLAHVPNAGLNQLQPGGEFETFDGMDDETATVAYMKMSAGDRRRLLGG